MKMNPGRFDPSASPRLSNVLDLLAAKSWFLAAALALLFSPGFRGTAAARNQSQIFFDASGSDQGAFGPDQIVTISGNLTFFGRSGPQSQGGIPDTFFAISDVYILPKGYLHTRVARVPLRDVNGSPNTILGSTGGGFFEQVIAATMPQGNLKSGEYDVVVDEHQDGFFDPSFDLHLGSEGGQVLSVFVPSDVPGLPGAGIAAMKQQAIVQFDIAAKRAFDVQLREVLLNVAQVAETGGDREELFFLIVDLLKEKFLFGQQCNSCPSGFLIAPATSAPNLMNEASALLVQMTKKYNGIAADPADPDFRRLVSLSPATRVRLGE